MEWESEQGPTSAVSERVLRSPCARTREVLHRPRRGDGLYIEVALGAPRNVHAVRCEFALALAVRGFSRTFHLEQRPSIEVLVSGKPLW